MARETQLTRRLKRRLMYIENKDGDLNGAHARIGWVRFSKSGATVYYRGRELLKSNGMRGNFLDIATSDEYSVSSVKRRGSNSHRAESGVSVLVEADALDECQKHKSQ